MSGEWDSKVCQLCNQELSGRGVWKYCSDYCRKEAKRQKNREDYVETKTQENEGYRKHRSEVIRFSRFRNYHGLTKPQLEPLVIRVASLQNRPPLFNVPDFTFYIRMTRRAKSQWKSILEHSPLAHFIKTVGILKLVRKHCLQQGELIIVALTLYIEAEMYRQRFWSKSSRKRFLEKSRTRINSAKLLCELATSYYPGDYKAVTTYLSYILTTSYEEILLTGLITGQTEDSLRAVTQLLISIKDEFNPFLERRSKIKRNERQDLLMLICNQVNVSYDLELLFDMFLSDDPLRPCPKSDFFAIAGWQYGTIRKEVMLLA